jgi:hypothetical protein
MDSLLNKIETDLSKKIETTLIESICESVKILCSTSQQNSKWSSLFVENENNDEEFLNPILVQALQSALLGALNLKSMLLRCIFLKQ